MGAGAVMEPAARGAVRRRDRNESADSLSIRVQRAKPPQAVDACWDEGTRIDEPLASQATGRCNALYPSHSNPRRAAGGPVSGLVLKCQLKPVSRADYPGVVFNDALWRELNSTFPGGVCDYTWSERPTVAAEGGRSCVDIASSRC